MTFLTRLAIVCLFIVSCRAVHADETTPRRVLLIGQGPDGHPKSMHEFAAGVRFVKQLLAKVPNLEVESVVADADWSERPEQIREADGVFLFVSQGARWMQADPRRFQAFEQLAARGGGVAALHWAIGSTEAKYNAGQLKLLGATRGGPTRKLAFLTLDVKPVANGHPILRGVAAVRARDEFYYALETIAPSDNFHPLMQAEIEGRAETLAWAWDRPDGGRSFGFVGMHYHENWRLPEYRRLVAQGILWTLKLPISAGGVDVDLADEVLTLQETDRPTTTSTD